MTFTIDHYHTSDGVQADRPQGYRDSSVPHRTDRTAVAVSNFRVELALRFDAPRAVVSDHTAAFWSYHSHL